MTSRRPSLQDRIRQRQHSEVVGRDDQLMLFRRNFGLPRRLIKLENNEFDKPDFKFVAQVAAYYHGQGINARGSVEFDPNGQQTPGLAAALA